MMMMMMHETHSNSLGGDFFGPYRGLGMNEMARECRRLGLISVRERYRERDTEPWLGFKVFEASEKAEQKCKEDLGPKRR